MTFHSYAVKLTVNLQLTYSLRKKNLIYRETINKLGIGNEGNWNIIKNSSVERILDQSETKAAFKWKL